MAESSMSPGISEAEIAALREALCAQQQILQKLNNELDVEREASSSAACEALSMILRLQGEKAAVKMEASQYKRMAEEKMCHAEEALAIFEDLIFQKEMEIASLDYQVQAYRYRLLSLGVSDVGVGETKFPENLLQRNETLAGDIAVQSISRRNSMPQIQLKYHKKGIMERERSESPDLVPRVLEEYKNREQSPGLDMEKKGENYAGGDINSYWEQIRKLDERVREITDYKGAKTANLRGGQRPSLLLPQASTGVLFDSTKGAASTKPKEVKSTKSSFKNEAIEDSVCSSNVYDVFEVPQTHENGKGFAGQTQEKSRLNLEDDDEKIGKSDPVPREAIKSYANNENVCEKKVHLAIRHESNLRRLSDGCGVDSHFSRVCTTTGVAGSQAKFQQLNMASDIIEVERQALRGVANGNGRREEELKLLKEIKDQLNSIQSEIRSLKINKSSPQDELPLTMLKEAMLHFWL